VEDRQDDKLAVLLARRETGGELAGRTLAPGRTVVVSEESPRRWNERRRRLPFGPSACFLCRPFAAKPTPAQWLGLIDRLAELHDSNGVDLAVIDPLAAFLPGRDEGNAGLMLEALLPLQRLTNRGLAVLLLHHPRKGVALDGQAARGSGALSGHVDIVVEMSSFRRAAAAERRRLLCGHSRFEQTPRELILELNAEGTDYQALGEPEELEFTERWRRLRPLFEAARTKLTRAEVLAGWPASDETPAEVTLWRWLEKAVGRGLLGREGGGGKRSPFRYWIPGREQMWQDDLTHRMRELTWKDQEMLATWDQPEAG
jgi:hypothetical protein